MGAKETEGKLEKSKEMMRERNHTATFSKSHAYGERLHTVQRLKKGHI